jgi:hypothetical protein
MSSTASPSVWKKRKAGRNAGRLQQGDPVEQIFTLRKKNNGGDAVAESHCRAAVPT